MSRSSSLTNDVPANAASSPSTRSSSVGWPIDSWTCSAIWLPSMMTVVVVGGHGIGGQQRGRLLGDARRVARQVEREDRLPAALDGLAAVRVGIRAGEHLAVAERVGDDAGAALGVRLLDAAAFRGAEDLVDLHEAERRVR